MPTTCPLTTGYTYTGCDGGPGGAQVIYFCELANKTGAGSTVPTITAGVITAWSLATGKIFRKYTVRKNTAFFTDTVTKDPLSGAYSYKPTVNVSLFTMATSWRQEVQLLVQNALMVIVLDQQGVYRLLGYYNGMDISQVDVASGTAFSDAQKQVLTLVGEETIPALEINSATAVSLGL